MKNLFEYKLIEIGTYSLSLLNIVALLALILIVWIFLKIFKKFISGNRRIRKSKQFAVYQIIKYVIIGITILIALELIGVNVKVMLAGSAALLVGVGLGLQNLFNDFVSGIIILLDATVKVNDIIEVNGLICKVQKINTRTTIVLTRDDKYIILPNSTLTGNQLINWTHGHEKSRFEVKVGVDYSTDIHKAMSIIKTAAEEHPMVVKDPEPFVRFFDFGDSSIDLVLLFWSEEVFRVENIKSEIRTKIFDQFAQNGITIPFPQRVLHVRKQVSDLPEAGSQNSDSESGKTDA
jgi:small-conductance mechanosensitive channel